jgi:hypothetical protein
MVPVLPLALVALGGLALALGGKKKGAPSSGVYHLDANLPPATLQQVLGAIANVKDPSQLLQMATQMAAEGYPLAGNALRMRAAELTPGAPLPDPQGLDGNMDPATRTAVLQALATESDPNKLMTFAGTIQLQYPIAAGLLVAKANALGGGTPMAGVPQPGVPVANAPAAPPPAAPALPAPVFVAPMAPQQPAAPPPGISPAMLAQINAALASGDANQMQAAAQALVASQGSMPSPQAQAAMQALQIAAANLQAAPAAAPTLDNVLPPRPPAQPMPPPNATPLGPPAPPPPGQTWILATNADVSRDGVQSRYVALLSSPVGTEVHETHNGRLWKLRVISHTTDPGLTTYAKDVKGWVAQPSSVVAPAAAPPPAYVPPAAVAPAYVAPAAPAAPTQQLTGVQQAALDMANALTAHGYKQADQGIYKAFQSAAGMTADGFPGRGTMQTNPKSLFNVLASAGLPPPNVPIYPWHSMPGTSGYDGVNAPTWAQWSAPVTTSGHGRRIWH